MNPTLTIHCPFCGKPLKVLDTIPTVSAEGTANMSICSCGVMDVIVKHNKVVAIRLHNPELHPDYAYHSR